MIDRVTEKLGRKLYELPISFKWFVNGLLDGSLAFGGEESASASFVRMEAVSGRQTRTVYRSGFAVGRDHGSIYSELAHEFGDPVADNIQATATPEQKQLLLQLSPQQIRSAELAGEKIQRILTRTPGNDAPIGGVKVTAESGWFAARPSGTGDIYKIYAESFRVTEHLQSILEEAEAMVSAALEEVPQKDNATQGLHQLTTSEAKAEWRNEGNPN
jgi:phosphoglucomutase